MSRTEKSKKKQKTINFDIDINEYIDKNKGRLTFSVYANQLMGEYIDQKKKK